MKCASCGNVAPEGASYCPECGAALAVEPAASEAAAAPVPTAEPAAIEASRLRGCRRSCGADRVGGGWLRACG